MAKVPMSLVYKILEEENQPYSLPKRKTPRANRVKKIEIIKRKPYIPKPKITYTEYILNKIKTYKDLMTHVQSKDIFIMSFVYNSGVRNVKSYNNRCEFIIRVNKEDLPTTKIFLLNKFEVEQTLTLLKNLKGAM